MAAARDQRVHQLVAVGERPLHRHAVGVQRVEQRQRARRRVQAHRHAHLRVPRGEARQQHRHPPALGRHVAQARAAHRQARHPRATLDVRHVARHRRAHRRALRVALLERDHAAQDAAVELRDRHLRRRVQRRQPRVGLQPRRTRRRRAHRLDHRHVECRQRTRVPFLPLLSHALAVPRRRVRRPRAARREHRHHQRVHVAVEQRQRGHRAARPIRRRRLAAQRVAPHRQRVRARVLDRLADRVHKRRVASQAVRAVEAEAHRRAVRVMASEHLVQLHVAHARQVHAQVGHVVRRLEPVPFQQERVRQEAQQLLHVLHIAVAQVLARLRHRPRRSQRQPRHLRVRLRLATQRQQRDPPLAAALAQHVEPVRPATAPTQDPAQHHARAVEDIIDKSLRSPPRPGLRSAPPESRPGGVPRPWRPPGSPCPRWS